MKPRRGRRNSLNLIIAALLSVICMTGIANAGKLFTGPINSPAGKYPWALAAGDFNGDGITDLAVTNNTFNSNVDSHVRILLGKGDGTFQSPVGYHVGAEPNSVVVGDLNRDGNLDLAVISYGNSPKFLGVLLGNGDGTFRPQVRYKVGLQPAQVVVGDFNGDGNLDLAVTNSSTPGFVSILLGNSDGTFQPQIKTPVAHYPNLIAVADLNGDGKLDLVVATGGCGCPKIYTSALLGNGDGTFQPVWTVIKVATPTGIVLGDFNGDGKLDLAETHGATEIALRLGNGDGTFQKAMHSPAGGGAGPFAVADYDGDGKLDIAALVSVNGTAAVSVLLGKGDGFFKPPLVFPLSPVADPIQIVAADVNGDGKPDLVLTDHFNKVVSVLLNTGHK